MKVLKFIENVSNFDEDGFESVSVSDCVTACKIAELDALIWEPLSLEARAKRIDELEKELRNVKYK